ncbi:MAG: hypothetical protein HY657_16055 [Acidobacteria bacterium]|nr:hypothetical protein [Acidobacteriota bacterium]
MVPITRRAFVAQSAASLAAATLAPAAALRALADTPSGAPPIRLGAGTQLFVDDYLVAQQHGIRRVVNAPARLPYPIATAREDRVAQPYLTVLRDPETGVFRMWYNTIGSETHTHIGYMESADGVRWLRPHLELPDPAPISFGASVIDEGPAFADWRHRYKMAWDRRGMMMATSPDGLTWRAVRSKPLIGKTGDAVSISRDPYRNRYVVVARVQHPEGLRILGQNVSEDPFEWSHTTEIIVPGTDDEDGTEFYSMSELIPRGGLLIGLLKVLRDNLPAEPEGSVDGIGYTVLAWTRDGEHWHRDKEPFMDRNPLPNTWDRAMTWGDHLLPVGDHVYVYYGGYPRGHKIGRFAERALGVAFLPRDRYVARAAGPDGGLLRTAPVRLEGSSMAVNAAVAGELRVRLLDLEGRPLHGFDFGDCVPLEGDSLAHHVRWRQPLAAAAGWPLQIEFLLRDASLYAFEIADRCVPLRNPKLSDVALIDGCSRGD